MNGEFSSCDFIYYLIDPMNLFDILSNNGTIINRKIFDYEIDKHEYNVTIIAQDRKNQGADRGDRDDLRIAAQRHRRCRRADAQSGQRGRVARRQRGAQQQRISG